jgi:uncharacterized lipoprotein YddW (UPF0748 family)
MSLLTAFVCVLAGTGLAVDNPAAANAVDARPAPIAAENTTTAKTANSLRREVRAVWNPSGTGGYPGDWERSAKLLADNGFNLILPNMLTAGMAHYASDVLPPSEVFRKYGDQLAQCCAAAKRHGLEVHVWKCNFNLAGAPRALIDKLRREHRTQVNTAGKPYDWLCPSDPENQKLEVESMVEVVRKYPIDGLHFDYIRYPEHDYCYCDACRKRFEAQRGRKIPNRDWPNEYIWGPGGKEYNDWRCRQITAVMAAVSRQSRKIRPEIKISAAVFGDYPVCRQWLGQDWLDWVKAGYLDMVFPMNYRAKDTDFAALVRNQLKLIGGRVPLYAGIGATATQPPLSPERVRGQIDIARKLGAQGFAIFDFNDETARTLVPAIGLGAGSLVPASLLQAAGNPAPAP